MKIEQEERQVKFLQNHEEDCDSVKMVENGDWDTPWTIAWYEAKTIDERSYLVLICNSTECEAELAVPAETILEDLPVEE